MKATRSVSRIAALGLLLACLGCARGLNSLQKQELDAYEARGLKVEEDSETAAAWWGLAPGGGSFYTGNTGLGIVNLLFWPLSICWDPISGANGAESNNYAVTMAYVRKLQDAERDDLDTLLLSGQISTMEHALEKAKITRRYRVP